MKDVAACEKSRGGGKQPLIRECPNGETPVDELSRLYSEYIGVGRELGEVKHLSTQRKRNKFTLTLYPSRSFFGRDGIKSQQDSLSSGERNGNSPNHSCLHEWGCRAESAFSCNELQIVCIEKRVGKRDPSR